MQYLSGENKMGSFDITFPPPTNLRFAHLNSPRVGTIATVTGHLNGIAHPSTGEGQVKRLPIQMFDITFATSATVMSSTPVKGT